MLLEEALLAGDVLATGYFCAERAEIKPDGGYAVIGCGSVGLMAIIASRELGAEQIYAIDNQPARLALAEYFGAISLNFERTDPLQWVAAATVGRGVEAAMEAVGDEAAMKLAFALVRPAGIIAAGGHITRPRLPFRPAKPTTKISPTAPDVAPHDSMRSVCCPFYD